MYQIENDVPPPKDQNKGGCKPKYPWVQLQVGQSFVGDRNAGYAMNNWNLRHPETRFVSRTLEDGKVRIWRVA